MPPLPPLTKILIFANVAIFIAEMMADEFLIDFFALWPIGPGFAPWQLITYSVRHGSVLHLFFNMLALYMFGSDIERIFGERRYLVYYLTCVLSAALAQLLVAASAGGPPYPTVGASGGVFGGPAGLAPCSPTRIITL